VLAEDLQRLAASQSQSLRATGHYGVDFAVLGFEPSEGVTFEVVGFANAKGWTAVVMHEDLNPLDRCAMWDGVIDEQYTRLLPGGELLERRTVRCTFDR